MHTILFLPQQIEVNIPAGTTILAAARKAGVLVEAPCNGSGFCGKCRVQVNAQQLSSLHIREDGCRTAFGNQPGFVLACLAEVFGDITVTIPDKTEQALKIVTAGEAVPVELNPVIKKQYDPAHHVTWVMKAGRVVAEEEGDTSGLCFGAVVDIGTTTLVLSVVDLTSGVEVSSVSALNPQSLHGQDVLSRIQFAAEKEGLELLFTLLAQVINSLLEQAAREAGIALAHIYEIVYSGNTCMLHLATGVSPSSLGQYPYTPLVYGHTSLPAKQCLLTMAGPAEVYLPPIISPYVGADISTGLLAAGLHKRDALSLFVDIGTNGEMVLAGSGKLVAASTAAGPAFEGMNIACGMRASLGAVEHFAIDRQGRLQIDTIGSGKATGICGSGLLDIAAELVKHGIVAKNGRFVKAGTLPEDFGARLVQQQGTMSFVIADGVFLSQKDLRQIQLAKGAIRAGIELLLRSQEAQAADVAEVLIAGSFGYHLRPESLLGIGLLPREFAGKIRFVGNTSQAGGMALLLNGKLREELADIVKAVQSVELSQYSDFDRVFVDSLNY